MSVAGVVVLVLVLLALGVGVWKLQTRLAALEDRFASFHGNELPPTRTPATSTTRPSIASSPTVPVLTNAPYVPNLGLL